MKNLKKQIQKKQISLLSFTLFTLLFSCFFINCFADDEKLQDLQKRLSLQPPTEEDFKPIHEVINNEIYALKLNDFEKAYFFYTSKEFKKATSFQEFKQFIQSNSVLSSNQSITPIEIRFDQGKAFYKGKITDKNGTSKTINFQFIQENGRWKILGVQVQALAQ